MKKPLIDLFLVSGNITLFCGSHADDFKNDILHSSLFGQLVSEKPDNTPTLSWTTYTDTLSNIGWIISNRGSQHFESDTSSLFNIVEQTAGHTLSDYERRALANAFSELKKLPRDSLPIKIIVNKLQANSSIISEKTQSPPTETLLTTVALLTIVRHDKTVVTLRISFETTNVLDIDILDQPILKTGKDGKTNIWSLSSSLNERQYNKFRDTVTKKLGRKIATDLLHIRASAILDGNDQMKPDV